MVFKLQGYCMSIPQTIFGAFSIASEYIVNHAGNTISNADYVVSDINNPFTTSEDFAQAYSDSIGINYNPNMSINEAMDWLSDNSNISDVDLSDYPATEAARFITKLSPDGFTFNQQTHVVKQLKFGAIRLFYIAERATKEAVARTFDKIAVSFDTLSKSDIDNIQNSLASLNPYDDIVYTSSISFKNGDTYYTFNLNTNAYFYNDGVGYSVKYIVPYDVVPSGTWNSRYNGQLSSGNIYVSSPSTITINGTNYKSYELKNSYYGWPSATDISISDLELIKTYIGENGFVSDVFNSELVDSSFVPYTVPSLRGTITGIDDIYPALQAVREGVISIPSIGDIATSIPDVDDIADIIARAIAEGISQVKEDDEPIPEPTQDYTGVAVPDDFPEAPIFDPLVDIVKTPFAFFSIFEPIFYVFGASFNFFGVWLCVPVVMIILLIIWALK